LGEAEASPTTQGLHSPLVRTLRLAVLLAAPTTKLQIVGHVFAPSAPLRNPFPNRTEAARSSVGLTTGVRPVVGCFGRLKVDSGLFTRLPLNHNSKETMF
jgi:hypothetical protein